MELERDAVIGVDVGGTHTDVSVQHRGRWAQGKALTTYDDFSCGLLAAIEVAAARLDIGLRDLLGQTGLIVNGTTVVTNAVTQMRGSRVGALVTRGFRDTFRFAGGPRRAAFDDHVHRNVPDLMPRRAIVEVRERIDGHGMVVHPLDTAEVETTVRRLVEELRIEALAVCFLSSYLNAAHELAAEAVVRRLYPALFVSLSHRVSPMIGETRRWTTAALNAFVQADTLAYLDTVEARLREAGFRGRLSFFQGLGGGISKQRAARLPLALLGSGPAAGAIGAARIGKRLGRRNLLLGDMGGTSFDTALLLDGEIRIDNKVDIGPFQTGVALVDVISVGSGGGSIVSISERGVPTVGPRSAGSTPGPACYGRGGTEATVTDAMVAMGFIDPDNYLGGRVRLDRALARAALAESLGDHFGWTPEKASAAVHDLAVTNMANALREVSVARGHDPRDCLFLAYGGGLGVFAWQIAAAAGVPEVCIPSGNSVFCARSLLASDCVVRRDRVVNWPLDDLAGLRRVNALAGELLNDARAEMAAENVANAPVQIRALGEFRYRGQVHGLTMPMPVEIACEAVPELAERFTRLYEEVYGEGAAWQGVTPVLLAYSIVLSAKLDLPMFPEFMAAHETSADVLATAHCRPVYLPSLAATVDLPIVNDEDFPVGGSADGPFIIDAVETTIFVPPGVRARRDTLRNYLLEAAPDA